MLRRLLKVLNLVLGYRLNSRLRMRLAWPECSLDGFTARACKIFIAGSQRAEGIYCGQWLWHVGRWGGVGVLVSRSMSMVLSNMCMNRRVSGGQMFEFVGLSVLHSTLFKTNSPNYTNDAV